MARRELHLVTGATGFVGAAIVLELLTQTDAEILCLIRPKGRQAAAERLRRSLLRAARAYGMAGLRSDIIHRCQPLVGDVTRPRGGVDSLPAAQVDQVWHVAGSLLFQDRNADEIFLHNLTGTAHVLELARLLSAPCFNHVSTAYIAGRRTGLIEAVPTRGDDHANNCYERSKIAAENKVLAADIECIRVFRPAIVIGHSVTYAATNFTGLYGFIRGLAQVRSAIKPTLGDYLAFRPLRIWGEADALINFVPVDRVATAAVGVALRASGAGIYHLANSYQVELGPSMVTFADRVGILPPVFVKDRSEFSLIDERVDKQLLFYHSYMTGSRQFDLTSTQDVVGSSVLDVPLPPDVLGNYIDWYLNRQSRGVDGYAKVNH